MRYLLIFNLVLFVLAACSRTNETEPLIIVATPEALDAGFQTYEHPSQVFSLRIPPHWIPDQLPNDNGLRMQFTSIEDNERVVRLSVMVVNTGKPLTAEAFMQAVNAYQPPNDLSAIPWQATSDPSAMSDGSVRLTGIRDYPTLGPRALNIFLQGNGSYFSVLEVDVTDISSDVFMVLMAVVNTYRVEQTMPLSVGQVMPVGVTSASGVIAFEDYLHWQDQDGGFNITGRVVNLSGKQLEAIRLTAYLFDREENQLAEQADVLSYDVLKDQESASFRLRFDIGRPSTAVRYELHAAARAADFSLAHFYGTENFLFGQDRAYYNTKGNLTIAGLIQNNAGKIARSIKVLATVFNEQGQVVASETSYINKQELVAGEATEFEVIIYDLGGNAYRYTLKAQGFID